MRYCCVFLKSLMIISSIVPASYSANHSLHKSFVKAEYAQNRAYSESISISHGRTIYLAGMGPFVDGDAREIVIPEDFEQQVRLTYKAIDHALKRQGASIKDLVYTTTYITDVSYGPIVVKVRKEIFGDDFPTSALITIKELADPAMKIEIQGVAVVKD
jgi:2-iminobutanoate/2-iminopropanoate deaminase